MEDLLDFKQKVINLRKSLVIKRDNLERLTKEKENLKEEIDSLKIPISEQALLLLQKLSEKQRISAKIRLEELGNKALQYSMGPNYRMKIEFGNLKKRPEAYVKITKDKEGKYEEDPLEDNGGGVIDIISLALRVVVMQTQDPPIDGPIIFDEPFKMLSKEYVPMMADFLKKIKQDFDRQIIMVTHNDFLAEACDTKIVLGNREE